MQSIQKFTQKKTALSRYSMRNSERNRKSWMKKKTTTDSHRPDSVWLKKTCERTHRWLTPKPNLNGRIFFVIHIQHAESFFVAPFYVFCVFWFFLSSVVEFVLTIGSDHYHFSVHVCAAGDSLCFVLYACSSAYSKYGIGA